MREPAERKPDVRKKKQKWNVSVDLENIGDLMIEEDKEIDDVSKVKSEMKVFVRRKKTLDFETFRDDGDQQNLSGFDDFNLTNRMTDRKQALVSPDNSQQLETG